MRGTPGHVTTNMRGIFVSSMKKAGVVAAGVSAALLIAACSSNSSTSSTTTPATSAPASASASATSAPTSSLASSGKGSVEVILPDTVSSTRYVEFDAPLLTKAFTAAGLTSSQFTIQ